MKFSELKRGVLPPENLIEHDVEITGVTSDSREVRPGYLFVAVPGTKHDGREFIGSALANGAVAVVSAGAMGPSSGDVIHEVVSNPRQVLGKLAHKFYGNPASRMKVVGITGTNGKTSTAVLFRSITETAGHRCAILGTLKYEVGDYVEVAKTTTPGAVELARFLKKALDMNATHVVMEVSSHALDQGRVEGIEFDVAVFTNLTQDHLDYHADMEEYLKAKINLFTMLREPGIKTGEKMALLNADDQASEKIQKCYGGPSKLYGIERQADFRALDVQLGPSSSRFVVSSSRGTFDVQLNLVGRHNVYNALAAASAALLSEVPADAIREGLQAVKSIPGRFERVDERQPFDIVVDYAHTEDGLVNLLTAARAISKGRLIVVFGCGGDRDRTKRPKMGRVVASMADFAIITSDNPRTEDPAKIILDVEVGFQKQGLVKGDRYEVIEDRREAIGRAIEIARAGDMILLAGKGHETYQILGDKIVEFDDREVARSFLRSNRKL